jgi:glucose-6-phosphate 1-dehydrogenase
MTDQQTSPIIVIFGITGDLSKRKLLPALYHLLKEDLLPHDIKIIGTSRRDIEIDDLLGSVELCVLEKDSICDPDGIAKLRSALQAFKLDPVEDSDYESLKQHLDTLSVEHRGDRIFYMSLPPSAYAPIIERLSQHGMNDSRSRILLEKPFGYDETSARELIDLVNKHYKEDQIYRIDHYLAKETAQNLLTFRMHNPIFTALWAREHIDSVHIEAAEELGIENRADFYDKTGALRDLIQSHLMQLLALTMMDIPIRLNSHEIHLSKQYFLEQLMPANTHRAYRAQYTGYKSAVNNDRSSTETYAKIHLEHGAERWQGVDIILETGKALPDKHTRITVQFKGHHGQPHNKLVFQVQPNEGISLDLFVKQPGLDNTMQKTLLDLTYDTAFEAGQHIDAYERVLVDAARGDQALFASANEVMATWHVLQPIIDAWDKNSDGLMSYESGSYPLFDES